MKLFAPDKAGLNIFSEDAKGLEAVYLYCIEKQCFHKDLMSQYSPENLIGKGSTGTVYRSKHLVSSIDYAIKIVNKAEIVRFYTNNDTGYQEVDRLREITKMNCRNVVGLVQAMEDDNSFYFVTRYVGGGTLVAL